MVTQVSNLTAEKFAARILRLFPKRWSSSASRLPGGKIYSMFLSVAQGYVAVQSLLSYVWAAERIATAEDDALDLVGQDFFDDLKRIDGESDIGYRARIQSNLFAGGATRARISAAFQRMTGTVPRIIEPFLVTDCAILDLSYVDLDTVDYPSRIGDPGMRGAFLIESPLPSYGGQGNNPVYGLDAGLAVDYGWIIDSNPTWFLGETELDNLLNKVRMLGIQAGRSYASQAATAFPKSSTKVVPAGATSVQVDVYPPMSGQYIVLPQPTWNTNVEWQFLSTTSFLLTFETPPEEISLIDWFIAPITSSGYGQTFMGDSETTKSIAIPSGMEGAVAIAAANWNSSVWLTSINDTEASFEFRAPSSLAAELAWGFFSGTKTGTLTVEAGAISQDIDIPAEITDTYRLLVRATWNTNVWTQKNDTTVTAFFSDAPPADSPISFAFYNT